MDAVDAALGLIPPLLGALETLGFVSRHLHPPRLARLAEVMGPADDALRAAAAAAPPDSDEVVPSLRAAVDHTLAALDELRAAVTAADLRLVYRGLRHVPRAQEALYALAELPPVSRYFLEPAMRADQELMARLEQAQPSERTGVHHIANESGSRGGFSLYVPEYYTPDVAWPLVVALHGGSGHGRGFLWSWLREARGHGAILATPTSTGGTWALGGPDGDTPNLARILHHVASNWRLDRKCLLLTGMSDGGTFTYVTGLRGGCPFTHLAPISAAFHPMLVATADSARLRGLPIRVVHGALDWMFSIELARQALQYLQAVGADASLIELADLSHCYPREQNPELLAWLRAT